MKPQTYKIEIKNGRYPDEYCCSLYNQLHLCKIWKWDINVWMHIKSRRGPHNFIFNMANRWGHLYHCEVTDKTIENWIRDLKTAKS